MSVGRVEAVEERRLAQLVCDCVRHVYVCVCVCVCVCACYTKSHRTQFQFNISYLPQCYSSTALPGCYGRYRYNVPGIAADSKTASQERETICCGTTAKLVDAREKAGETTPAS